MSTERAGLLDRLAHGPIVCAEGYLFECERRGYLQAGAFVPEVVLEHPDVVSQLHREFVHAGSDVVQAFTYYAHREKLRVIGKEDLVEQLNRRALELARDVAAETGTLLAGDLCNTNVFTPDATSRATVRAMFEEQVGWAVEANVDYMVGETFSWGEEALIALDVMKEAGLATVITLAIHQEPMTREGWTPAEACGRLEAAGADVVGLNCIRGPRTMLPLLRAIREQVDCHVAGLPVPYRTHEEQPTLSVAARPSVRRATVSDRARPVHLQPLRDSRVRHRRARARRALSRRLLRRGTAPHSQPRRGGRARAAGEPLQPGHVQARLSRHRRRDP